MIKLNTPKEVHEAMWKDGARWTSWPKDEYIKFNDNGKPITEDGLVATCEFDLKNNDTHFWTPYIPPKPEQMTDTEMLAIIAKKPWINHVYRIYNDFLIQEIDSVVRMVFWDAKKGRIPFNVLKSNYLYSFDLIEWKEFVK